MSGSASERVAVVTAGARSLPALKYSIDEGMPAHGPIRSAVACGGSRVVGTERGRIFMLQAPIHGQEREKDGDDKPRNGAARHPRCRRGIGWN
jgi:hypothetical protein